MFVKYGWRQTAYTLKFNTNISKHAIKQSDKQLHIIEKGTFATGYIMNKLTQWHLTSAESLDALIEEFWTWRLDNSPEFGTKFGVNNHDDQLEQFTEEAFTKQKVGLL